ncbi:MAG: phytanoyl-CoA dioxygenase family protein [Verrucomicrobia bacterium]|nr:phytanoyl-CoA dioxygenase family protein [Verrucomicrobiota bacterium]
MSVTQNTAKSDRDLSFVPVNNPSPKRLTRDQIDFYNEHGYVQPFTAYDQAGADRQRDYFQQLLDKARAVDPEVHSYRINGWHTACQGIYEITQNPLILDCVEDIIGPDIIAWGTHYFSKEPHDPKKVAWHQDASYWPLTPARTVTVWLAIDDADRDNAAMMFLPGTHHKGHLVWREAVGPAVLNQEIADISAFGSPVYDELKAGQFSLHADMLAHGSDPNPSDRRRCGLTIRYCPPLVRPLDPSWGQNAIHCRGKTACDHWVFPPIPTGDDVTARIKPIGGN